jgi:hypothetical protein
MAAGNCLIGMDPDRSSVEVSIVDVDEAIG